MPGRRPARFRGAIRARRANGRARPAARHWRRGRRSVSEFRLVAALAILAEPVLPRDLCEIWMLRVEGLESLEPVALGPTAVRFTLEEQEYLGIDRTARFLGPRPDLVV